MRSKTNKPIRSTLTFIGGLQIGRLLLHNISLLSTLVMKNAVPSKDTENRSSFPVNTPSCHISEFSAIFKAIERNTAVTTVASYIL